MTFIIIFSLMMITIAYLSGCSGVMHHETGTLTCFGYCELGLSKQRHTIETEEVLGVITTIDDMRTEGFGGESTIEDDIEADKQ